MNDEIDFYVNMRPHSLYRSMKRYHLRPVNALANEMDMAVANVDLDLLPMKGEPIQFDPNDLPLEVCRSEFSVSKHFTTRIVYHTRTYVPR